MPEPSASQPIEVLLVEDDPGDVLMTQEAFEDYKIANRLSVVTNGEDAIAYLRKQGRFADVTDARPRPARPQPARGATAARCCATSRRTPSCAASRSWS